MFVVSSFYCVVLHRKRRRGTFSAVGPMQLLKACESICHSKGELRVFSYFEWRFVCLFLLFVCFLIVYQSRLLSLMFSSFVFFHMINNCKECYAFLKLCSNVLKLSSILLPNTRYLAHWPAARSMDSKPSGKFLWNASFISNF